MSFLSNLIDKAKGFLGEEHKPVETQAVVADRFDHANFQDMLASVPPLNHLVDGLQHKYDYVPEFVEDLFQAAYKADPEYRDSRDMDPRYVPNKTMVEELTDNPEFKAMRANTRGDEYGATMAMLSMKQVITDAQVHLKEARQRAEEAAQAQQEAQAAQQALQQMMQQAQYGPQPDPNGVPGGPGQGNAGGGLQAAYDAAAAAQQAAQQAGNAAQQAAQNAATGLKADMRAAAEQAASDLDEEQQLMRSFGVDDGALQRMDFNTRRELAGKLRNNRLAKFAKLLGQFKMVQQAESRRRVENVATEVVGVKLGDDLQRLIPAEMLNIATPELEMDFWQRWADHSLLMYDMAGKEKMGQGPVICVVDESGSMGCEDVSGGSREAWSKALSLALCEQARTKGRDFHYIGFSSSRQQYVQTFHGGKTDITKVIEMTEHFWGGGTHYEEPLRMALKLIEEFYDAKGGAKPDIVFMTDDEYGTMDEKFMHEWNRVKDKTSVRCFGVAIGDGVGTGGAMSQVSDNVRNISQLTESDPRVMADLFRTI